MNRLTNGEMLPVGVIEWWFGRAVVLSLGRYLVHISLDDLY